MHSEEQKQYARSNKCRVDEITSYRQHNEEADCRNNDKHHVQGEQKAIQPQSNITPCVFVWTIIVVCLGVFPRRLCVYRNNLLSTGTYTGLSAMAAFRVSLKTTLDKSLEHWWDRPIFLLVVDVKVYDGQENRCASHEHDQSQVDSCKNKGFCANFWYIQLDLRLTMSGCKTHMSSSSSPHQCRYSFDFFFVHYCTDYMNTAVVRAKKDVIVLCYIIVYRLGSFFAVNLFFSMNGWQQEGSSWTVNYVNWF